MQRSRDLVWDGLLNVRDLGGHPTEDGGETRFGSIVRADSVRQLSDEGWEALVDYGVKTVVDLRADEELEADPPAELPVEVLHVPFMETDRSDWQAIEGELDAAVKAAPDTATATRDVYLIFLERFNRNVAAAVRAVANAPEGGVVIHCAGGKDRTGLLTALLLHLAGVGTDEIAQDYALSEERLRTRHEQWLARGRVGGGARAAEAHVADAGRLDEGRLRGARAPLRERRGVTCASAGLTDDELARARARLRN